MVVASALSAYLLYIEILTEEVKSEGKDSGNWTLRTTVPFSFTNIY